jgi:hypothetical protein
LTLLDLYGDLCSGCNAIALHEVGEDHRIILTLDESV